MGQRSRLKSVRRKAVDVVRAQSTTEARLDAINVFRDHGIFNLKKAREVAQMCAATAAQDI